MGHVTVSLARLQYVHINSRLTRRTQSGRKRVEGEGVMLISYLVWKVNLKGMVLLLLPEVGIHCLP
jgi:hypothetical protein